MSSKYQSSDSMIWLTVGVIIFTAVGLFGLMYLNSLKINLSSGRTNRQVALTCTTNMATAFHIHPVLQIIINGEVQKIPANIGIKPTCMNSLHTHDDSGVLHVEAHEKRDFTLSDFFAVWNKTYTKDQILDYKVDEKHIIRETVNGQEVQDYENTILRDRDEIIIYYQEKTQ